LVLAASTGDTAVVFIEIGLILFGLGLLARLSERIGLSPIPAYLIVGLAFGSGGFLDVAAEIGVVLLLFTLGLEYTPRELSHGLRTNAASGLVDLILNATPGVLLALVLGWSIPTAVLLGGITYISSSGVVAKVLRDLQRLGNRETPVILSILVIEDLVMALYLPVVAVMIAGSDLQAGALAVTIALAIAGLLLIVAIRYGHRISRAMNSKSDESLLLGVVGLTLVIAGIAQELDVSAAVGAFLVGISLSGPVQERASSLIEPLRDLFAGIFFVLFAFRIDPTSMPPVLLPALILAVIGIMTKMATGWLAGRRHGFAPRARIRAGTALVARGEFSIVIAGLSVGTAIDPRLLPLTATYVLILAVSGPVLTRFADSLSSAFTRGR
jgi:CPA2 family monovalent cation:H+ antiporter-2